ncbi:hypothetical protein MYRNA_203 [Mycobacterium phage Myrna]|uniref:Uncharacterized protein n=1 Tax=Mycobacterium phage Myrna TaxID=546805 RepID=B5LJH5_9CAUD|nr:gp203 [Mycobacterium phage Myrna]ACH62172.1 hypothetical protein MYRNA_203 [Mycobacterium phage Myrna]
MTMTLSEGELNRQVSREVARVRDQAGSVPGRTRGQKCRICSDPDARRRVNSLLSIGMGPTEIVRNLEDINLKRKKNAQIGFWSVRDHRENHFNIQEPAKAAILRMLEDEYQREHSDLLAEGVGNILTGRGYLKIVAQKGFQQLIKDDTTVGFTTGLEAQLKLDELEKDDRDQAERAMLRRDVGLIQQAIREEFTEEEMRRLSRRLNILRGVTTEEDEDEDDDDQIIDAEVDEDDEEGGEVADFVMGHDDEDPLED